MGQRDERLHDGRGARGDEHVVHERAVDLDMRDRQPVQVAQRRIAGAEIVQRNADAMRLERIHLGDDVVDIAHQHALRQFQFQQEGIGARFGQQGDDAGDKTGLAHLACADVDGDRVGTGHRIALPLHQLPASRLEDPVADLDDEIGLFGMRNECARTEQAALRVHPAHQRFGARHVAAVIDDRLVEQDELLALQGLAQGGVEHAVRGRDGKAGARKG